MEKIGGVRIEHGVAELFGVPAPPFAKDMARAFADAQTKRIDADYDLNKPLSEADARLLRTRVSRVRRGWSGATLASDRDFKHALCLLILVKGRLRADN